MRETMAREEEDDRHHGVDHQGFAFTDRDEAAYVGEATDADDRDEAPDLSSI